jgi:hypothetical protein
MPKVSIELNRPDVRLPAGLRETVEHLPDKVNTDVRVPDVDLSKLSQVARSVATSVMETVNDAAERASDLTKVELPSEVKVKLPDKIDLSKIALPTAEDIGDSARSLADRLPKRRRRTNPIAMLLSVAAIAGIATVLANWSKVGPWLGEQVAALRRRITDAMPMGTTEVHRPGAVVTSGYGTPVADESMADAMGSTTDETSDATPARTG